MANRKSSREEDPRFREYLAYETERSVSWRNAVSDMSSDWALAILPWPHPAKGPAAEFEEFASELLGNRCFILNSPGCHEPSFWQDRNTGFLADVLSDLRDALVGQGYDWNKEEMDTALHSRVCVDQLLKMMDNRRFHVDISSAKGEAWGASFEGCVIKYSCNLRRLLGLSNVIEIEFDRTVPDTYFLLRTVWRERIEVNDRLRLFLFEMDGRPVGLFVATSQSLADRATYVDVPIDPDAVTVVSKWDGLLWPGPMEDETPERGIGLYEPPQELVTAVDGKLRVPVCAGMAYRLAKSPAYIFAPPDMVFEEFRDLLVCARMTG